MPTGRAAPPRLWPPTAATRRRALRCRQGACRRCAASLVARIRNAFVPGCAGRHVSRLGRLTLRGRDQAARHVHHRRAICSSRLAPAAAAARGGCVCGCERCVPSVERPQVSGSSAAAGRFRGAGRGQRQAQRQEVHAASRRPARPFGVGRVPEFLDWWAVGGWCCCRRGGCRWWERQHPDAARPCRCSLARPPSWR